MTNLEKLLRFLVKEKDYQELVTKTGLSEETVKKFTMDVFAKIIPVDFTKQEGSHIEQADLVGIVNNFNDVVKEDNLKVLITNGVKKYGIGVKDASGLLMAVIPIIHKNIQVIAAPSKAAQTKPEPKPEKVEEKKEADKIYDNIASRANEDLPKPEPVKEEPVVEEHHSIAKEAVEEETKPFEEEPVLSKKELKEKKKLEKKLAKEKAAEEAGEENPDDEKLSTVEKVCIYVVLACLALLIVSFVVILIMM